MNRRPRRALLLGVIWIGLAPSPVQAQTKPALEIRIERDPRKVAFSSELAVNVMVTVTERDTGRTSDRPFEVYAFAGNAAGEKSEIFPCGQENDNSPEVPKGIYACTVIVDRGGEWEIHGVVNEPRTKRDAPLVVLGETAMPVTVTSSEIAPDYAAPRVSGQASDVVLLWGHSMAAAVWMVSIGLLSVLALPSARRRLSAFGLHRLEEQFELAVRCMWSAAGLVTASGIYMLLNLTAYDTPFSFGGARAVSTLPYGAPYFLSLATKIGLYALMLAASMPIVAGAKRRLRDGPNSQHEAREDRGGEDIESASPWRTSGPVDPPASSTTAVKRGIRVPSGSAQRMDTARPARWSAMIVLAGAAGISVCVTLLKYFHELIEAARSLQ